MPEQLAKDTSLNMDEQAFEYVTGTLRGEERERFKQALVSNPALQDSVCFWEEQLMPQHSSTPSIVPKPATWRDIEARLAQPSQPAFSSTQTQSLWQWLQSHWGGFAVAYALVATIALGITYQSSLQPSSSAPNTNYVAVLENSDQAVLTALTSADEENLWLQWAGNIDTGNEGTVQLWAQSKRDGQIRSIAVFDQSMPQSIHIDVAALRLIRDAEYLLLSQEEAGGSAIDEPSANIIATGRCVRLLKDQAA